MKQTLVIHLGGIGDFLLTLPALVQLRRDGPVQLLGARDRLQLAVDAGLADDAHDQDALEFDTLFSRPSPRLRAFLRGFDRCIAWMRPDDRLLDSFRACGVRHVAAFPGLPPADWPRHASRYYLECLGLDDPGPVRLSFNDSESPDLDVVIHPGSGGRAKNWPLDNFILLAEELKRQGRRVAWCTGPAEQALPSLQPTLPPMPLTRLARILAGTRLYIGNDSGITHLAAATGIPTIAIFGSTNPVLWAPQGKRVKVVTGDYQFPLLHQVLEAVEFFARPFRNAASTNCA